MAIRPKTQANRIDQLKEIIRAWGENPEELLTKDALLRGNITDLRTDTQSPAINPSRATKRAHKEGGLKIKTSKKWYLFAFESEETSDLTTTKFSLA